ncbi:MAG: prepilin-type N-terminal cleavage/methylation domain-containing protein [Desulfobacterales bacterium]|nr:prepilin-type N-terminal cleavage/methylation domain-containing protein [Desulfobacterales bacterium]
MRKEFYCLNQKGFTLIEMVSVMIIMGVVASVSIQKFDIVSDTANQRALTAGIKELNVRESLEWSNAKISTDGYATDEVLWTSIETFLGTGYEWNPNPPNRVTGGTLSFKTASRSLTRQPSTETSAGKWH